MSRELTPGDDRQQAWDLKSEELLTTAEIEALTELTSDESDGQFWQEASTGARNTSQKTFFGSDFPTALSTEAKNRAFLAQVLQDKTEQEREIIMRIAMQTDIRGDDPLFIILLATGQLELLLHKKPAEIEALFGDWYEKWSREWRKRLKYSNALFREHAKSLRNYIQETQDALEASSQAALDAHGYKIADAANKLVKRAALTKVSHDAVAITKAALYVFLATSIGVALGLAIPLFWKPPQPQLDPAGARQLTLEEAKALSWAMSDVGKSAQKHPDLVQWATSQQGQYARELMQWNQVLLSKRGSKFLCEKDAEKLGLTLRLEGRETKSGFCTLWVRSPRERRYLE